MRGHPHLLAFFAFNLFRSCSTFSGNDTVTPVRLSIEQIELGGSFHNVRSLQNRESCSPGSTVCEEGRIPLSYSDFNVIGINSGCCEGGTLCCGKKCIPAGTQCCIDAGTFCPAGTFCCIQRCAPEGSTCCAEDGNNCPAGKSCCGTLCLPAGSECCPGTNTFCSAGTSCSSDGKSCI
jgi:hypothetical protein